MDALTTAEVKTLNGISQAREKHLLLGALLQTMISSQPKTGTPVNAVNAAMVLTLTGVVIDGETVTINNPLIAGSDVYEFLADAAQTKTAPGNIAVDIQDHAAKATRVLTVDTKPTSGDTMTIGTRVYTFVPVGTANGNNEISIGADLAAAQVNIVAAINGSDGVNVPNTQVRAADFAANACTLTALVGGTAANAIATTETFTAGTNVFAGATMTGGTDCAASDAITHLVAAIIASDTQGVGAADGAGDTIDLTADVAGASGNDIALAETLANGEFTAAAVKMAGGVNGTVGVVGGPLIDASYLYLCVADNTVSGKNWRRISLGAAF